MKSSLRKHLMLAGSLCLLFTLATMASANRMHRISTEELHNKIAGGWAGKMIGVSYGAPTEFKSLGKIWEGDLPEWTPDRVFNSLRQDDLYVNMTLMQTLEKKGRKSSTEDFGTFFRDSRYALWHANLAARRALRRGLPAGLSGMPEYNVHANDIDFQIEADFIGLLTPGLYLASNGIADRVGRVMNYGDGLYGGMFVAGMYSAAFVESDVRRVVENGLACIPSNSPYAQTIMDVLVGYTQYPDDWKKVWQMVQTKWDQRDPCPSGAMHPFNIDAKINGAYIVLGLLYGKGDLERTMEIATRSGQDSDCNPSSAAGILGVMMGYRAIPNYWKKGIAEIEDKKFDYTDHTFKTIVDASHKYAVDLILKNGGREDYGDLLISVQKPKAPGLEIWDDYGAPVESISIDQDRWHWEGEWTAPGDAKENGVRTASARGAEAMIEFEGTGVIVVGPYVSEGGKADIYLDGKKKATVDVCSDEKEDKHREALWHKFGLRPGSHSLRVVVCGEPYRSSRKADVTLERLIVFRK